MRMCDLSRLRVAGRLDLAVGEGHTPTASRRIRFDQRRQVRPQLTEPGAQATEPKSSW